MGIFLPRLGPAPAGPFLPLRQRGNTQSFRLFIFPPPRGKVVRRIVDISIGEFSAGFRSMTGSNS
jgi:hypothetical protein